MNKKDYLLSIANRMGLFKTFRTLTPGVLTVLNYHRIDNPDDDSFPTFKPNISATPSMFATQMEYLDQNYNVVSGADVVKWITEGQPLPPRSALITFDDGYYDNLSNAFPVLATKKFPAVIFLASDYIGCDMPFYWDLIAFCFYHTEKDQIDHPSVGMYSWQNPNSRDLVMRQIIERVKKIPEREKKKFTDALPGILAVNVPDGEFSKLLLTWDDVRDLSANGIEMGGHTASHPILTRIPLADVESELISSKNKIEAEINRPVTSFAYPNGQSSDFNSSIIDMVKKTGFQAAYTLLSGPTRFATVRAAPYQIRRVFLSYKDTLPKFAGKLMGAARAFSI